MKRVLAIRIGVVSLVLTWLCLTAGSAPKDRGSAEMQPGDAVAFVVNKANPVPGLSMNALRRIFLLEDTEWSNGRRISVVMRERGQPERAAILHFVYRMTESEYNNFSLGITYRGRVPSAPKSVSTSDYVRKFISYVPGAIGYLRASEVNDSVKTLQIDGLLPNDERYKIRILPK